MKVTILFYFAFFCSINSFAQWGELGGTLSLRLASATSSEIYTMAMDDSGNVFVGGHFQNSASEYYVVKYDRIKNNWSELGAATTGGVPLRANSEISNIASDHNGNIYASGTFTNSVGDTYIARWDKMTNSWSAIGSQKAGENIVIDKSNNVYVDAVDSSFDDYIAKWDGLKWSVFGTSLGTISSVITSGEISKIVIDDLGLIYALKENHIVINDGTSWIDTISLSSIHTSSFRDISTIAIDPDRNIYLGGKITDGSGTASINVYKLDSKTKTVEKLCKKIPSFPLGFSPIVHSISAISSSEVYVGGSELHSENPYLQLIKWKKADDNWTIVQSDTDIITGFINCFLIDTITKQGNILIGGYLFNSSVGGMNVDQFVGEYKQPCNAYFTLEPSTAPHIYTLTQYCKGSGPIKYIWTWGDGKSDTSAIPSHTYDSAGTYQICVEITDSSGCSSSFCTPAHSHLAKTTADMVIVNSVKGKTTSFKGRNKADDEFSIYPNPALGNVTIEGSCAGKKAEILLTDLTGKVLLSEKSKIIDGFFKQTLQLSNLASGMYFIQLKTETVFKVLKLVKN